MLCVQPLIGLCLYFLRPNATKPITTENITHEINFMFMDCSAGLLHTLDVMIDRIFAPVLRAQQVCLSLQFVVIAD